MPIPFFEIELGEKIYKLRFGMGAMVSFEQSSGKKLMELDEEMSIETVAQLLWAMLKQEDKNMTFDQALCLVDSSTDSIVDIINIVTKVINAAFSTGKNPNAKTPTSKKNS
jgi:hypothetical protein